MVWPEAVHERAFARATNGAFDASCAIDMAVTGAQVAVTHLPPAGCHTLG